MHGQSEANLRLPSQPPPLDRYRFIVLRDRNTRVCTCLRLLLENVKSVNKLSVSIITDYYV